MDGLFANKVFFSVLATGLLVMGLNEASHGFFHHEEHEQMGYFVEIPEAPAGGGPVEEEGPVDYLALMTAADASAGAQVAVKCQQCHSFEQGGGDIQGPNLFGVLGRDIASEPGYDYSSGENGLADKPGVWDYAQLDTFLERPRAYASNTAMNFVGLRRETERADMIAYLRTLNTGTAYPMPEPLPVVEEVETPEEGAPAEDGATVEEGAVEPAPAEAPAEETPAPAEH